MHRYVTSICPTPCAFLKPKCGLLGTTRFESFYDLMAPSVGSISKQLCGTCDQSQGSGFLSIGHPSWTELYMWR